MFDLEKEVAAWSEAVYADRCSRAAGVAELSDHLYCEIDRGRASGLSDEAAFRAAVARLGAAPALAAEHVKNRSLLQRACAAAMRYERSGWKREDRSLLLAHAILWAALMLAYSLVAHRAMARDVAVWLLLGVLMPCWWASEQLLRRALRAKRVGG